MENEFVTYEQALALKELGFDEKCLAYWFNETPLHDKFQLNPEGQCLVYYRKPYDNVGITNGIIREYGWAPLYQQAFRWFREKYGLCNFINFSGDGFCSGWEDLGNNEHGFENFKTYEEAESACLDKLIEISFLILADGKTHLPSKGDKFIKEDGRIILNNGEK